MEYLMTYGWAILIVIIVAAALYALGVFTPSSSETEARFATLGTSPAHTLAASNDLLFIKLPNQVGKTINVSSVAAEPTAGGIGCTVNDTTTNGSFNIAPGEIVQTSVDCAALSLSAGDAYSLKVTIAYIPQGGYAKTDSATVTGIVVQ
jgi:hypothetical protein